MRTFFSLVVQNMGINGEGRREGRDRREEGEWKMCLRMEIMDSQRTKAGHINFDGPQFLNSFPIRMKPKRNLMGTQLSTVET